jgi:hypothetical protein
MTVFKGRLFHLFGLFHILVLAPYLLSGFRWADLILVLKDRELFVVDSDCYQGVQMYNTCNMICINYSYAHTS